MRRGFTLIELLVLIALTIIFEAILHPVASRAIAKGSDFGYFLYLAGLMPILAPMLSWITKDMKQPQPQIRQQQPPKGLAIIELLMVLALIGILASILIPIFARAAFTC